MLGPSGPGTCVAPLLECAEHDLEILTGRSEPIAVIWPRYVASIVKPDLAITLTRE
jgi:hypothetical protein